jgi:hypothetical protein
MIENGKFCHLRNACPLDTESILPCTPNVTYKFLAGFNRQKVTAHNLKDQSQAVKLLNNSPGVAIHYMLSAIVQSENDEKLASINNKQPQEPLITAEVQDKKKLMRIFSKFTFCSTVSGKQKIENRIIGLTVSNFSFRNTFL